jgi:CheY-like chemotaxis protein
MILWVDDNDDLRRAVAEHLRGAGYRVVEAASAEEALKRLDEIGEEGSLSLLLTDFRLPGMNGLELARCLRNAEPGLPVLLVTSHAAPHELISWTGDPAFRKLDKPFELDRLQLLIKELLAGETIESEMFTVPDSPPPPTSPTWVRLALAASLSIAVLLIALPWLGPASGPPALPALPEGPATHDTQRSGVLVTVEPFGPLAAPPERFVWRAVEGAERYAVEITTVDGRVLWRGDPEQTELAMPAEVAGELLPLAAYYWQVEALDAQGGLVAASEAVRFRIVEQAPQE